MAGPAMGEYSHFQPGPAISMSYDDLKVIEAMLFLTSIAEDRQLGASIREALATSEVLAAIDLSAASGHWEPVERGP